MKYIKPTIEPLLVNGTDAAIMMGIKPTTFYKYRNQILARGIKPVITGRNVKYTVESIRKAVQICAEKDIPLYESEDLVIGGSAA